MRREILKSGTPFFCDFYHLTMAQGWFLAGKHEEPKTSEAFFRKNPFNGSYLLAAGLGEFLEWIENWKFSDEDAAYLRKQKDAWGKPLFTEQFLKYMTGQNLNINIQAVPEGELVFPNEPVASISGPNWQVELVEAAFLNIFNSQSLIATKASRMVQAAQADGIKRPVMEFGLRRSQELGCFSPTRAAFIGGCNGTSNVAAAQYYNIPVKGTMAHSFVMSFEDETEAFKAYLRSAPGNSVLLPDTYETHQGILNSIQASRETGIPIMGARIDSGDLAYWYHQGRRLYDEAGMPDVKLIASNDLDEYVIENLIMVQGAKYDMFAAGTKLVTAYDTPALGGVYKTKRYNGVSKIKVAEGKTTIPGATNVVRVLDNGMYDGDIITDSSVAFVRSCKLIRDVVSFALDNSNDSREIFRKGREAYSLLKPVVANGKLISDDKNYCLKEIQRTAADRLSRLDKAYKRLSNPHVYGVGLEQKLADCRKQLILAHHNGRGGC